MTTMQRRSAIVAMTSVTLAPQLAGAQDAPQPGRLPAQLVEDLHAAFGNHRARAVHTKGVILRGSFAPGEAAQNLSSAVVFTRPATVTVRFSDFTGLPDIPDTSGNASPRG